MIKKMPIIAQHWDAESIILSYVIAVTGSYCTIQLMEQWRLHENKNQKLLLLFLSAFALGGCGIWCMHFTGMNALQMTLDDGSILEVDFEGGLTILSFFFAIAGVFIGLKIASNDPFFLELETSRRKEILVKNLANLHMEKIMNKNTVGRQIKIIALFSRPWFILLGGFFTALGVLGMHYIGMIAQRTQATPEFNVGIIVLSSFVAFFTANAAFWILFRALTFWPQYESLRFMSALIMGVAVCGTHYIGMCAATYEYSDVNSGESTTVLFKGSSAHNVASHGALVACYWLTTFAVVKSLRDNTMQAVGKVGNSVVHPDSSHAQTRTITCSGGKNSIKGSRPGSTHQASLPRSSGHGVGGSTQVEVAFKSVNP